MGSPLLPRRPGLVCGLLSPAPRRNWAVARCSPVGGGPVMVSPNSLPGPVDYVTSAENCVTSGEGCSSRDPHLDVVSSTINPDHPQPSGSRGLQKDDVPTSTTLRYSIPQVSYYVGRYCYLSNVFFPSCEPMFVCYLTCWLVNSSGCPTLSSGSELSCDPEFVSTIGPARFRIGAVTRRSLS